MIECPKCSSTIYDSLFISGYDNDFNDFDTIIETSKVKCCACGYEFYIREFYTFTHAEVVKEK